MSPASLCFSEGVNIGAATPVSLTLTGAPAAVTPSAAYGAPPSVSFHIRRKRAVPSRKSATSIIFNLPIRIDIRG